MDKRVEKYFMKKRCDVVSLITKIIEIPTVNPPGENYEEMVSFLEKKCKAIGLKTKKHITPERVLQRFGVKGGSKRVSLVADWKAGAKKTLHIASHYDVVPATDKWKTDPYKAVIKGDKIYGRGSEDMKGNIASVLFALEAIKRNGIKPNVNLQISFTPDEETGGRTGLGFLVDNGLVTADYAMSEGYSGEYVSMGNKGVMWAEIAVKGKASHASMPHKGVNAFEHMAALAMELEKLKKRIERRKTKFNTKDAVSGMPTFVMGGLLEGGVKVNVVPGIARFSIDRRLIPEETVSSVQREIEAVIKKFNAGRKQCEAYIEFSSKEAPSISPYNKMFFNTVSQAIKDVTGKSAKFCLMPGATDLRYFMWKGIPALGYSSSGGEKWHGDNEFVSINSLVNTAKVYAKIITEGVFVV
ncbi:MAG TPA: ArgE/DapE family deacylase [Candidatus Omnitrophica bacterium]|nr:ArgE/DapE family deacylase [Candidatus Omnitrophota bacterium]